MQASCEDSHNFVCMMPQFADADSLWSVHSSAQLILPLDQESLFNSLHHKKLNIVGNLVSLTEDATPAGLLGSAGFMMNYPSHLKIPEKILIYATFGVTILSWIFISHSVEENQRMYIFDEAVIEEGFGFFIIHKENKYLLGVQLCSENEETEISCTTFFSHSTLKLEAWNYVGISYSTDDKKGTFFIDDTFGTNFGSYFYYDTLDWLKTKVIKGPIIGNNKDLTQGFGGYFSCLQFYEHFVSPSQSSLLQTCSTPDDYKMSSQCPGNFFPYKDSCFYISEKEEDFSSAEFSCSSTNSDQLRLVAVNREIMYW